MLEKIPRDKELNTLMGRGPYELWVDINSFIDEHYALDTLWNKGGSFGVFELKYRKSGKTIVTLYPKENMLTVLMIFGKRERGIFDTRRAEFSESMVERYDTTHQHHDGKWMFIDVVDANMVDDIKKMILIKKNPNKKRQNT